MSATIGGLDDALEHDDERAAPPPRTVEDDRALVLYRDVRHAPTSGPRRTAPFVSPLRPEATTTAVGIGRNPERTTGDSRIGDPEIS